MPLKESDTIKVYPVCLSSDGMIIKPGLNFDTHTKTVIGLTHDIDIEFIRDNPNPEKDYLKSHMVVTAEAHIVTSLDGCFSLPVGVDYLPKGGNAESVLEDIQQQVNCVQTCYNCLKGTPGVMCSDQVCKTKVCDTCIKDGEICDSCVSEHSSIYPSLRRCDSCSSANLKCIKIAVFGNSQDCESKYKGAMKLLNEKRKPHELMYPVPDTSHNGKNLKSTPANWWPVVDGYRVNIVLIRVLRECSEELQAAVPLRAVRGRDRMDVEDLLILTSPACTEILKKEGGTVCTIVPELFRVFDANKPGVLLHPLYLEMHQTKLMVSDYSKGVIKSISLHYPATLTTCISGLQKPCGMVSFKNVLIVAESGRQRLLYYDPKKTLILNVNQLNVAELKHELKIRGIQHEGLTKPALQERIKEWIKDHTPKPVMSSTFELITFEQSEPVDVMTYSTNNLMVLLKDKIMILSITANGASLQAKGNVYLTLPFNDMRAFTSDQQGNIYATTKTSVIKIHGQRKEIVQEFITSSPYGIVYNRDTNCVVMCDQDDKVIKEVTFPENGDPTVKIIAGQDNVNNTLPKDGNLKTATFSQPTGLLLENNTLFICDTAVGRIRVMTNSCPLAQYLSMIGSMLEVFKIHLKGKQPVSYPINTIISKMEEVLAFFTRIHKDAQIRCNKSFVQGPEGSPPIQTIESVQMVIDALKNISRVLLKENPNYPLEVKSLMTLVCEHLFTILRSLYDMPTKKQFAELLARSTGETLKAITNVGFHYYTSTKRPFYPIPTGHVKYGTLPKIPKPEEGDVSTSSEQKLKDFARKYGQSVRQQTVRSMSTKDRPGTYPIELYEKPQEVIQPLIDVSGSTSEPSNVDLETLYTKGSVLLIRDKSSQNGFSFVQVIQDIAQDAAESMVYTYRNMEENEMQYKLDSTESESLNMQSVVRNMLEFSEASELLFDDQTFSALITEINGDMDEIDAEQLAIPDQESDEEDNFMSTIYPTNTSQHMPVRQSTRSGRASKRPSRFSDSYLW